MFDWRIYWSVLAAMLTFSCISAVAGGIAFAVMSYNAQKQVEAAVAHGRQVVAQQQAQRQVQRRVNQQRRRESQARDLASRTLSSSQMCVGGTVVDVSGSTYTQRIQSGRPVACRGRLADQPLR